MGELGSREKIGYDAKTRKALYGDYVLDDIHDHRVNRHTFSIYIGGDPRLEGSDSDACHAEPGVEHHMADRLDINLDLLSSIDPTRPILIQVASCGGNWTEGMQMFGAILTCPNPITVLATKWARSMTSLIPLAADRFLLRPPAQYMFHHGTFVYAGLAGEEATTAFEDHKLSRDMMMNIYVARLRAQGEFVDMAKEDIREMLEDKMRRKVDVWLDCDTAVRWGFADGVYVGDVNNLRAPKKNLKRREQMLAAIRQT